MNLTEVLDGNTTDVYNDDSNFTKSNATWASPEVAGSLTNQMRSFQEVNLIKYWGVPVGAMVGFILNCVTIALMRRPKIKNTVMGIYFAALAAVDIVFLVNMFLMHSDKAITGFDFNIAHRVSCKIINFIMPARYAISSWIMAVVALERCMVVLFPLKAMIISNERKAKITITAVVIVVALLSCHPLITMDVLVNGQNKRCSGMPQYQWFQRNVANPMVAVSVSYVPFIILLACNILFVAKMVVVKAERKSLTSSGMSCNLSQFTFTAVMVCMGFCLCTVPGMIILVMSTQQIWYSNLTLAKKVARNIIPLMAVIRASINFFVYICTSKTFREEISLMCCGRCKERKNKTKNNNKERRTVETDSNKDKK